MSVSTNTTFFPLIANAAPKFAVVVVFPTPPFPDVMTITSPITFLLAKSYYIIFVFRVKVNANMQNITKLLQKINKVIN